MSTNVNRPIAKPKARGARTAALAFAAVLIAAPVLAQRHASPRGGSGGGGGGNSGGGGGHRSAGPSASAPSSRGGGGGGGGNWSGDGHRPPGSGGGAPHRPPGYDHDGGHGHGGGYYGGHYGGYGSYYYSPYYYPYYGFSFGFGYGYPYYSPYYYGYGYYPYSYGYRPYYYGYRPYSYYPPAYSYGGDGYVAPYGEGGGGYVAPYGEGTAYDRASLGAVAVRVKPKNAEVYVDGRYVGPTGSFDGFPSYLWVAPGQHRIEVVQVGYANLEQEIEVGTGQVVEIDRNLVHGESVRPAPPPDRYNSRGSERAPYPENAPYPNNEGYREDTYRAPAQRPPAPGTEPPRESSNEGRDPAHDSGRYEREGVGGLFLEVRPDDASVYLDGRFVGTGRDVSTATEALRLVPGEHRIQVIHPNYSNQERTVEIGVGEEKRVEVFLGRGAGV